MSQIAEVPIALVEIKKLADELTGMDPVTLAYQNSFEKLKSSLDSISILAESCTQTIKVEGLAGLIKRCGITREEKNAIEEALCHYHAHCWSALPVSKQEAVKTMIALFEALQVEAVADAPTAPLDQTLEDRAPEFPGISDRIDREIELVTQSKMQRCRVCSCTDDDCRQCFEKIGKPCYWIEPGLCSACAIEGEVEVENQSSGVVAEG